jgi:trafficking protein particle complex subunit 2
VVDKFNYLSVSGYVTQGGKIFLLLHNAKSEDSVRAFFVETHELYVKYLMNPFVAPDESITSPQFNAQVRNIAKKMLL